jgi:hypothetical protein
MKFDTRRVFKNMLRKFNFHSNLTRITGALHEELCSFMITFRRILKIRKLSEKIKTHVLCPIKFAENGALYEIMWRNMDDAERPQTTIHCGAEKCGLHAG